MFPLTLGGNALIMTMEQEDTATQEGFLCTCTNPPMALEHQDRPLGAGRRVDVTRTPYCFVTLRRHSSLIPGIRAPEGEVRLQAGLNASERANCQAHWYVDPILY